MSVAIALAIFLVHLVRVDGQCNDYWNTNGVSYQEFEIDDGSCNSGTFAAQVFSDDTFDYLQYSTVSVQMEVRSSTTLYPYCISSAAPISLSTIRDYLGGSSAGITFDNSGTPSPTSKCCCDDDDAYTCWRSKTQVSFASPCYLNAGYGHYHALIFEFRDSDGDARAFRSCTDLIPGASSIISGLAGGCENDRISDYDLAFVITDGLSFHPTRFPSHTPTMVPSAAPTAMPTAVPTTSAPTAVPTAVPSGAPSAQPSTVPSSPPTSEPTSVPTSQPTAVPTTGAPSEANGEGSVGDGHGDGNGNSDTNGNGNGKGKGKGSGSGNASSSNVSGTSSFDNSLMVATVVSILLCLGIIFALGFLHRRRKKQKAAKRKRAHVQMLSMSADKMLDSAALSNEMMPRNSSEDSVSGAAELNEESNDSVIHQNHLFTGMVSSNVANAGEIVDDDKRVRDDIQIQMGSVGNNSAAAMAMDRMNMNSMPVNLNMSNMNMNGNMRQMMNSMNAMNHAMQYNAPPPRMNNNMNKEKSAASAAAPVMHERENNHNKHVQGLGMSSSMSPKLNFGSDLMSGVAGHDLLMDDVLSDMSGPTPMGEEYDDDVVDVILEDANINARQVSQPRVPPPPMHNNGDYGNYGGNHHGYHNNVENDMVIGAHDSGSEELRQTPANDLLVSGATEDADAEVEDEVLAEEGGEEGMSDSSSGSGSGSDNDVVTSMPTPMGNRYQRQQQQQQQSSPNGNDNENDEEDEHDSVIGMNTAGLIDLAEDDEDENVDVEEEEEEEDSDGNDSDDAIDIETLG